MIKDILVHIPTERSAEPVIDAYDVRADWTPAFSIVHLSGALLDERARQAAIVAAENIEGVRKVHDHLCWVDSMTGLYSMSPEDEEWGKVS